MSDGSDETIVQVACSAVDETEHDWQKDCVTRECVDCGRLVWVTRWLLAEIARTYPGSRVEFICRQCGRSHAGGELEGGEGLVITATQLAHYRREGMADAEIAMAFAASAFGYGLGDEADNLAIERRLVAAVDAIGTDSPEAEVGALFNGYVAQILEQIRTLDGRSDAP